MPVFREAPGFIRGEHVTRFIDRAPPSSTALIALWIRAQCQQAQRAVPYDLISPMDFRPRVPPAPAPQGTRCVRPAGAWLCRLDRC
jgi:hypothetical protein